MKKIAISFLFIIIAIVAIFIFKLKLIRNQLFEFNTIKSSSQVERINSSNLPNFFEMNGKSATLKEAIEKIKNKQITADEENDLVYSIAKYNNSLGNLHMEKSYSYEEAEKLPDCPMLDYFIIATNQFYGFCKYFIEKKDYDTALLMAYMPITTAYKIQNEYANCAHPFNKLTSIKLICKACENLKYVINNSKPDVQKVKLIIKDLKNILEKDSPLSRCIEYEKYIINYELAEKAKSGNQTAKFILEEKNIKDSIEKPLNDILTKIDKPFNTVEKDLKQWQNEILNEKDNLLSMLNAFDKKNIFKQNMIIKRVFSFYYDLAREKNNEINQINSIIMELGYYCYSMSENNKETPDNAIIEKWIKDNIK